MTGRLSERDVSAFVRIVDAHDPRYAQAGHKDEGPRVIPRGERQGGGGSPSGPIGTPSGAGSVRLETVAFSLGASYDKVSRQLSDTFCHRGGDTVVCQKQDPCYNYRARLGGMGEIGGRTRGREPPRTSVRDYWTPFETWIHGYSRPIGRMPRRIFPAAKPAMEPAPREAPN